MTADRKRKQKVRKLAADRGLEYNGALKVFNEQESWQRLGEFLQLLQRRDAAHRTPSVDPDGQRNITAYSSRPVHAERGGEHKTTAVVSVPLVGLSVGKASISGEVLAELIRDHFQPIPIIIDCPPSGTSLNASLNTDPQVWGSSVVCGCAWSGPASSAGR